MTTGVYIDRQGDVWRLNGINEFGEQLLACDSPIDVEDWGSGPSFPWTVRSVEMWFGPIRWEPTAGALLAAEFADLEERAIAEADRKFGDVHGPAADWSPLEEVAYVRLIERVHRIFHPELTQAAMGRAA
jgi:hypothetical protein